VRDDTGLATRAWIVRTGLANRRAATFENPGAIALGWADVPGIGDLTSMDPDAIATVVRRTGRDGDEAESDSSQLIAFRDELATGDLVVATDARSGDVVIGTVIGDYRHDGDAQRAGDPYPHRRAVTWTARVKSLDVPDALRDGTRRNLTLWQSDDTADAWAAVAANAQPVAPVRRAASTGSTRQPARKRSAPVAKKKVVTPPPATERRCTSCGYAWPISQFVGDGTLCVECRS
jgi:predicted Mrr-cat superfamily restriction endonuclease